MKNLIFVLVLIPGLAMANFSKPEVVTRFSDVDAWNAPGNLWCFTGEPAILKDMVHMNCLDNDGFVMAQWSKKGFKIVARTAGDQRYSSPVASFNKVTWYEFDEEKVLRTFESTSTVRKFEVRELGPMANESSDSFFPYTNDTYFFKTKGAAPQFWLWKQNKVTSFFNPEAAYIFSPYIGPKGEIAVKIRKDNLNENAPDQLWLYNSGSWKMVLEDKDSNPKSRWKSFRNQVAVEGNKVLTVANDGNSDSLILIENGREKVIARAGIDAAKFDFFAPKMRAGTMVIRGEDSKGLKMTYVKDNKNFRKLIGQGDIVQSDLGAAKIDYKDKEAIFYGAPGIDDKGNIYLQATMSSAESLKKLLGIGLIKFNKE
jgi:hypothetical protein